MKRIAFVLSLTAALIFGATDPRRAPDVPVTLADGKQVKPSDFKGKVVIVAYILTT